MKMSYDDIAGCGAIICRHVAYPDVPILRATRDEPLQPEDSGWQFLCGVTGHTSADGRLWRLDEVVKLDRSILDILENAAGTSFARDSMNGPWRTIPYENQ